MSRNLLLAFFTCAVDAATRHHDCMCFPPRSVPQTAFCSNYGLTEFRGCRPLSIWGFNPLAIFEKINGGDSFANRQHFNLKLVRLDHNRLKEIPGDIFGDLKNLEEVDLSYNIIKKRIPPETFENNNKLRSINLSHNNLGIIAEQPIIVSHTAETLEATNCGFVKINSSTFVLPKLRKLNFSTNDINVFESSTLINSPRISSLDLSFNNIAIVSINFSVAVNLEYLDLSHNHLGTTELLPILTNEYLQTLNMSECGLKTITKETFNTPTLKILNVSQNQIEMLAENSFILMPQLNSLDLSWNEIKNLDFSLDIPEINLFGNPWICDCEHLNPHMTLAPFNDAICFHSKSFTGLPVSKFHNGDYCCQFISADENLPVTTNQENIFDLQQTEVFLSTNANEAQETTVFQKGTYTSNPILTASHTVMIAIFFGGILTCLCIVGLVLIIRIYRHRNLSTAKNKSIHGSELSMAKYKQVANDCSDKIELRSSPNAHYLQVKGYDRISNYYTCDPLENIYEEIL